MSIALVLAFLCLQERVAPKSDPAITRADIEACVGFLAADDMQGRMTGSPEGARAGQYLAARLAAAGAKPAGDDGTYLQHVPLVWTEHRRAPKLTVWATDGSTSEALQGADFDWAGGVPSTKRLRVRSVTKDEERMSFTDDEVALFLDGSSIERERWLGDERGAGFGLILTPAPGDAAREVRTDAPRTRRELGDPQAAAPVAEIRVRGVLRDKLRAGEVKALRVEADVVREFRPTFNVVGRIEGVGTAEHPELAREAIVFSAHYDHIGVSQRAAGDDKIMNGADDDASGCAAVLELAEAFGAGPAPARTLIFLFATGEEIGLVGTNWYVDHPAVALEHTACNLNFEMIGRADELAGGPGKLWLTGDERSNLGAEFRALGLAVVVDPRPEQHFFQRSDNYAFALRGVVAQTLSSYNLHDDYHHVTDEVKLIDFAHMETALRTSLAAARALADARIDPTWNEGGDPSQRR